MSIQKLQNFISFLKNILLFVLFPLSAETDFYNTINLERFLASPVPSREHQTLFSHGVCESLYIYHTPLVKNAIWQLKYKGNTHVAKILALLLYDHIIETLSEGELFGYFKHPILIPMPISKERLHERGWNQSILLTQALQKIDAGKFFTISTTILEKHIHTPSQTTLKRAERLKNLRNCFRISIYCHIDSIKNRNIILLDDVTTTGSTLEAAASVLKSAGAKNIWALTIAH